MQSTDLFHDDRVEEKKYDHVLCRRVPFVLFHFLTTPKRGPQTAIAPLSHNEHIHMFNIFILYCIVYTIYYIIYMPISTRLHLASVAIRSAVADRRSPRQDVTAPLPPPPFLFRFTAHILLYVHINPNPSPMLLFVVSILKKFSGLSNYNILLSRDTWTLIFMVSEK